MGRPKSLEQLNTEFQKYLETQDAKQQIDANITKYYSDGNWDDQKLLISGSYAHSAFLFKGGNAFKDPTPDWSLDYLIKMSDKIKGAIFGGTIPAGSTASPQDGNLADAIAKMAPMDLLITSAAFNIIEGILFEFVSSTKTDIQKEYATKELAPGLTMFLCIIYNEFKISDALMNAPICQAGYVYNIRFSVKQAGNIANFNEVNSLTSEQVTAVALASKCETGLRNLDKNAENYQGIFAKYNIIQSSCNDRVAALKARIAALKGA